MIEMPPATRSCCPRDPSQGECSVATIATLRPGKPGAGLGGVRRRHDPRDRRRRLRQHRVVSATATTVERESSAQTTTRGVRHAPALTLRRPVGDTMFRIGRNNTVQWTLRGVAGGVSIDLSRDDGATWTRLSDEVENVGFYDWTGAGDETSRARIRVSSLARPELTQTSPSFSIASRFARAAGRIR